MSYWKNKNVLITGASGFVGKHLFNKLLSIGADVHGIARKKSEKIDQVDVTDFRKINDYIKEKKINFCFHLAGESLVETGQEEPHKTFRVNTEGALNILESSRINNLEKVIVASTAHVYGSNEVPYLEEYTPKPSRPYETSKACIDLISQSYADTYNLPVLIPRFVNIFGPGDTNFTRLIPKTIRSVLNGENPSMWGGKAMREYLYIDDAIDAYLKLGEVQNNLIERNRIYNFGSEEVISVENLIKKIIDISGSKVKIDRIKDKREDEIISQYVSSEKAKKSLRWEANKNLSEALAETINWYKDFLA